MEVFLHWRRNRRKRLGVIGVLFALSWAVIFYGSFIEPRFLVVQETPVVLAEEGRELRIAVASDFHVGVYKREDWVARVVKTIQAEAPDLILLPGDFVVGEAPEIRYLEPLKDLSAPLGVFAVIGNHDYKEKKELGVKQALQDLGVTILDNERIALTKDGRDFVLAGVSDIWNDGDTYRTLAGLEPEETVILVAHNPDAVFSPNSSLADLIIAAHTHGGQIRLPWIGPIPQIPDALGQAFDRGFFPAEGDRPNLFITSGVSETGPRARLFVPP